VLHHALYTRWQVLHTWQTVPELWSPVQLDPGCGQPSQRYTLHHGSSQNLVNVPFHMLAQLPGTLFHLNFVKLLTLLFSENS